MYYYLFFPANGTQARLRIVLLESLRCFWEIYGGQVIPLLHLLLPQCFAQSHNKCIHST